MATQPNRRPGAHFSGEPQKSARHTAAPRSAAQQPRTSSPGNTGMSDRTVRVTQAAVPRTRAQRVADAKGSGPNKAPLVAGLIGLVVVGIALLVFLVLKPGSSSQTATVVAGQQVTVAIPEGSGGTAIASALKDAGVISSTDDFYKEVQKQNADQKLKSGTYVFVTGATVSEVVKQLVTGPNSSSAKLTIAEGLTLTKTAAAVESSLGISSSDFLAQAKASNYVADYPFLQAAQNDSLEGFLYPKTYDLSGKTVDADTVIRAMLDQYKSEVASLDFASAEAAIKSRYNLDMSDYQILTMASIVEKEAVTDDDRPKVASTFYNRLSSSEAYLHYLQSDATLTYALGRSPSADELHSNTSPYNTYLTAGLTPTPICSPSLASIKAALAPADTNYLYFWITDTSHVFSETYDEHLAAISASTQS